MRTMLKSSATFLIAKLPPTVYAQNTMDIIRRKLQLRMDHEKWLTKNTWKVTDMVKHMNELI